MAQTIHKNLPKPNNLTNHPSYSSQIPAKIENGIQKQPEEPKTNQNTVEAKKNEEDFETRFPEETEIALYKIWEHWELLFVENNASTTAKHESENSSIVTPIQQTFKNSHDNTDTNCSTPNGSILPTSPPGPPYLPPFPPLSIDGMNMSKLGWCLPLKIAQEPNPNTIPLELLRFEPKNEQIFIRFFTGTSKEIYIRQIFSHTPLDDTEQSWLSHFRSYCRSQNREIPPLMEPFLLRLILYIKRKVSHHHHHHHQTPSSYIVNPQTSGKDILLGEHTSGIDHSTPSKHQQNKNISHDIPNPEKALHGPNQSASKGKGGNIIPTEVLHKCLEHMLGMIEFRQSNLFPLYDEDPELGHDIRNGAMYWCGRDCFYRPLLVVNIQRLIKCEGQVNILRFKKLAVFCFEWGLRNLMIPGKVETCAVLLDIRSVSLHSLPISSLSDLVNMLTKQYPFRLNKMWVIHDSLFIQMVWNIAKSFLSEIQQQKIKFYKNNFQEAFLLDYNPSQLEKCYGGIRDPIKIFYPFPLASGPFNNEAQGKNTSTANSKNITRITSRQLVTNTEKGKPSTNKSTASKDPFLKSNLLANNSPSPDENSKYKNEISCPPWKAVDFITSIGAIWEGECRLPILWSCDAPKILMQESGSDILRSDPTACKYAPIVRRWIGKTATPYFLEFNQTKDEIMAQEIEYDSTKHPSIPPFFMTTSRKSSELKNKKSFKEQLPKPESPSAILSRSSSHIRRPATSVSSWNGDSKLSSGTLVYVDTFTDKLDEPYGPSEQKHNITEEEPSILPHSSSPDQRRTLRSRHSFFKAFLRCSMCIISFYLAPSI